MENNFNGIMQLKIRNLSRTIQHIYHWGKKYVCWTITNLWKRYLVIFDLFGEITLRHSLHKKCPYSELFWSAFSRISCHLDWKRRDTEYLEPSETSTINFFCELFSQKSTVTDVRLKLNKALPRTNCLVDIFHQNLFILILRSNI